MRRTVTLGLVLLGVVLMVIGYLAAAPWGSSSVSDSDPAFTGAPTLFLLGIASVVASAVVYEVLSDKRR